MNGFCVSSVAEVICDIVVWITALDMSPHLTRPAAPSVARTPAQVSIAIYKGFEVGELAERVQKLEVERRGFTTTDRGVGKSIAGESDAARSMEISKADAGAT